MPEIFARVSRQSPLVALGPRVYRKEMLRVGTWRHPDAPGGKLEITPSVLQTIISNFRAGVRDDVPVPKGHDLDALENSGHVVGLEATEDGRLFGLVEIKDDGVADDIDQGKLTGGSALINLNHQDHETGATHGPTLVHWAITNAPFIKGLAPYEAVALGEEAEGAIVISLNDRKEGSVDPIKEALEALKDASDEDIQKALAELRPGVLKTEGDDAPDLDTIKAEAKEEGRQEVVAALSEAGLKVELPAAKSKDEKPVVDVKSSPEYVSLAERVDEMARERLTEKAEALIDGAIQQGKVIPAQRDALLEVALSEDGKGLERVEKLIPENPVVDLGELGVETGKETNGVKLSDEDAEKEAARLVDSYLSPSKKGGE